MRVKFNQINRIILTVFLFVISISCSYASLDQESISALRASGEVRLDKVFGKEEAKEIADILKYDSSITNLDLYKTKIGDEGAQAIAEALKTNQVLTWLYLPRETQEILDGIKTNKKNELAKLDNILQRCLLNFNCDSSGHCELSNCVITKRELTQLREHLARE